MLLCYLVDFWSVNLVITISIIRMLFTYLLFIYFHFVLFFFGIIVIYTVYVSTKQLAFMCSASP